MKLVGMPAPTQCRFHIEQHCGVWSVLRDRVFYGDYLTRAQAIRSACFAACAVDALGGSAEVVAGGTVVPHQHLHRQPAGQA